MSSSSSSADPSPTPNRLAWAPFLSPESTERFWQAVAANPDGLDRALGLLELTRPVTTMTEDVSEEYFSGLIRLRVTSARKRSRRAHQAVTTRAAGAEPSFDARMMPALLMGKPAEVKRRLRPVIARAAGSTAWAAALAGVEHVPIEDVPSLLSGPPALTDPAIAGQQAHLYLVEDVLRDAVPDVTRRNQLVIAGMDRPWFCLAVVANSALVPQRDRRVAVAGVKKILRWWPDLIRWDDRFDIAVASQIGRPYPRAYFFMFEIARALGRDEAAEVKPLALLDPDEVAMRVLGWTAQAERELKP
jgi:hypothetical protein